MGGGTAALIFIIRSIAQLYLLVLLLRLFMPWLGASFNNPIAQAVFKLTSPVVVPVRRILPAIGRLDTATVVVAYAIQYLTVLIIFLIAGNTPSIGPVALVAAVSLVSLAFKLFAFAILIRVVLSWVGQGSFNPAVAFIHSLTDPILRPFQRIIPSVGGLDLSPLFATILLFAASIFVEGFGRI